MLSVAGRPRSGHPAESKHPYLTTNLKANKKKAPEGSGAIE
jgi:hypothetical protein